jgi:hypothetical protein
MMEPDNGLDETLRRHAETAIVELRGEQGGQQYTVSRHHLQEPDSTAELAIRDVNGLEARCTVEVLGLPDWTLHEKVKISMADLLLALERGANSPAL